MAQKKSQKEEIDALGQIYDFIFTEAKKPPEKRKPIRLKTTGISSSKALVDGLATALEAPGLIITDQILENMNAALTIEIGRLKANEEGTAIAKFATTSLVDFFSDPNKFLDKPQQTAKAIRKTMRAQYLGKAVQGVVANAWARKYNLDLDARKAILGHFQAESIGREAEAGLAFGSVARIGAMYQGNLGRGDKPTTRPMLTSEKNYIAGRSTALVGMEMFGRRGWTDMSEDRKQSFQQALVRGEKGLKDYMDKTYTGPSVRLKDLAWNRYTALKTSKILGDNKSFDALNVDQYHTLENRNLEGRISDMRSYIKQHPTLSANEISKIETGISKLEQAQIIVSAKHWDLTDVAGAKIQMRKKISDLNTDLLAAKRVGDRDAIRRIQTDIKDCKRGDRELSLVGFSGRLGQVEGFMNSWKSVMGGVGGENALLSILNGDFFDENKNTIFNPVKTEKKVFMSTHHEMQRQDDGTFKDVLVESGAIAVFDLANDKGLKGLYSKVMTPVYYLTPKSVMKSLFVNGEGFVYLAYLSGQKKLGAAVDWEKVFKNGGDPAYLSLLRSKGINISALRATGRLAKIFSFGQRQRDKIKDFFEKKVYKKMREFVRDKLISKIADVGAKALLEQWVIQGGIQIFVKSLAIAILSAVGIAATAGLGTVLVPALSFVLTEVVYGSLKLILKVTMLVAMSVVAIVVILMGVGKKDFDSNTYAYTKVVPGEVVENGNYTGTFPIIDDTQPSGEMLPFEGGSLPSGVQCLLGTGSYRCTQGVYGSYSHSTIPAVDIVGTEYFYAPAFCGSGNCVVTAVSDVNCTAGYAGGMVIFTATYGSTTYTFKLIHVSKNVSVGQELSAGQAVARVMTHEETGSACSSGQHLHLEVKANGSSVNPMDVLTNSTTSGGFGCSIIECPPK